MPIKKPYKTIRQQIHIPGIALLEIKTLKDRMQFFDPSGSAERLGICSAAWPLFGMLWPSGMQLAVKMAKREVNSGERILEIGCGLALASLVAHQRGADITASDRHPLAYHFLRKNLQLNQLNLMPYRHGQWGVQVAPNLNDTGAPPISDKYDLIIGSDLLYDPSGPVDVARFIDACANSKAQVWIMDPNRGYRNQFSKKMAEYGFRLTEDKKVHHEHAFDLNLEPQSYTGRLLIYNRA